MLNQNIQFFYKLNTKISLNQKLLILYIKQIQEICAQNLTPFDHKDRKQIKLMFRSIPVSNKICFDRELKRNWKIHQQKLTDMKSRLSKQRAEQFSFLEQSKKRNVLKDIQNRYIERSNEILFRRIQSIEKKGNKLSYYQVQKESSPGMNNRLLHEPYRKKQFFRIVEQNQEMLKRIRYKKSSIDVRKMERQRKGVEKNISLISEYKYKNYPATQTKVNLYMTDNNSHLTASRITNKHQTSTIDTPQFQPRCKTTLKNRPGHLHKKFSQTSKALNNSHYIITTYVNKNIFYIQVQNLENNLDKYRMQMSQLQLQNLLDKFYENKLQNLVSNLQIDQESQSCYLKFNKLKLIGQN